MKKHVIIRFSFLLMACFFALDGMGQDSSKVLKPIPIVEAFPVPIRIAHFENASPKYYLSNEVLQKLGARDIGDAMKFVPGTQIKDYGGVGGVKTVAFRSLGSAHTGVSLDNNLILNTNIFCIIF